MLLRPPRLTSKTLTQEASTRSASCRGSQEKHWPWRTGGSRRSRYWRKAGRDGAPSAPGGARPCRYCRRRPPLDRKIVVVVTGVSVRVGLGGRRLSKKKTNTSKKIGQ